MNERERKTRIKGKNFFSFLDHSMHEKANNFEYKQWLLIIHENKYRFKNEKKQNECLFEIIIKTNKLLDYFLFITHTIM